MIRTAVFAALAAATAFVAAPTVAQPAPQDGEWSVTLGAMGMYRPEYEGSDEYEFSEFPIIDIRYGRFFLDGRNGAGVNIIDEGPFSLAASVGYAFGRDEDDSSALVGMGDVEGGAAGIVQAGLSLNGVDLSARVSHQFTGDDTGTLVDLGISHSWRSREGWFVRPGIGASYATEEYMQAYFGVTPAQAITSGYTAYTPDTGFKSYGANLIVGYMFDQNWSLTARGSVDRLIGDAADSPLVLDETQLSAGLGLSYRF